MPPFAKKQRRSFRKPTPDYLANAALFYLSRYAASEGSLRRVLENKIRRAAMQDAAFAADHEAQAALKQAIEQIIETHKGTGVLNDKAYAEMKVHSLRRSGRSARVITQKLSQKGVKAEIIGTALIPDDGSDAAEAELRAAHAFAKKRGLGPYRKAKTMPLDRQAEIKRDTKEITTLARAGFSFDVAKRVLAVDLDEAVEDFT